VTGSTQFATLGYEGKFFGTTAASLTGSGFSVSYDATSKTYVMDLPAFQAGVFESDNPSDWTNWTGNLTDPSNPGKLQPFVVGAGRGNLDYTAWAFYQQPDGPAGWLAFGLATPQSAVPVTGSATYTATAYGYGGAYIEGKATLQFDFGASTLAGKLDVWDAEWDPGQFSYGHFTFTETVVGTGSSLGQFSGELLDSTTNQHGSFEGMFTGPNAQELMARWTATYPNPGQVMYGVWVGKKD